VTDGKRGELLDAEENHPGIARYTDMIMMKLDPAKEKDPNAYIGVDTYGRMKLSDLEDLGFEIEEDFKKPG